jgi:hypothetical protein
LFFSKNDDNIKKSFTLGGFGYMGIWRSVIEFLIYCKNSSYSGIAVDFSRTVTLGRQYYFQAINDRGIDRIYAKHLFAGGYSDAIEKRFKDGLRNATAKNAPGCIYSEPLFELLGANTVDSVDISDYEEATIIHDLTLPIPNELKNKYSCVFDGGLLEHVFDYPTALKNAMDMVAVGGHIILVTPSNNFLGHGFYQFSPELFYSVLREENGFSDTLVFTTDAPSGGQWYIIKNPREIHERTEVSPYWPDINIYVVSRKIAATPEKLTAYQSDYEETWISKKQTPENANNNKAIYKLCVAAYRTLTPKKMRPFLWYLRNTIKNKSKFKRSFIPIDLWKHPKNKAIT